MSERYSRIFSLQENLYSESSPVLIKAGALLRDNETGRLLAQLKLHSLSQKAIKLAKVVITCFDSVGRALDGSVLYEYLDLMATCGAEFGAKSPIYLPNPAVRSYSVKITEVGFEDNSVWTPESDLWEAIPKQATISSTVSDKNTLIGYTAKFGSTAIYSMLEYKDLILCTCGEINRAEHEHCHRCNAAFQSLKSLDTEQLAADGLRIEKEKTYTEAYTLFEKNKVDSLNQAIKLLETISDYEKSAELKEKCEAAIIKLDEKKVLAKKKKKKALKLTGIISGITVLLGLIAFLTVYPLIAYMNGNYSPYIRIYNIKNFEVPEGTEILKDYSFDDCENLKSVTIPDSVTTFENNIFHGCHDLEHVKLPSNAKIIPAGMFLYCYSLEEITIPDTVEIIDASAFSNCSALKNITIPPSVRVIGNSAFYGCESLTEVVIPEGVTNMGYSVFGYCDNLTKITIPSSVVSIGEGILKECPKLETLELPFAWGDASLESYLFAGTLPQGITSVVTNGGTKTGNSAFKEHDQLTEIILPEGLLGIDSYAFKGCTGIKSITIPSTVTYIGEHAFDGCIGLTEITIPAGITEIGDYAFAGCTKLTSINIPASVKTIGKHAFDGCVDLTGVTISAGVGIPNLHPLKNNGVF